MHDPDATGAEHGTTVARVTDFSLVVPGTGEVVDLDDPNACLRVLTDIRELESKLREVKGALSEALRFEFSRQGTKTLELNGMKVSLGADSEVVWDIGVLDELRALGLPEERMDALINAEISYRVNNSVAKQIAAANPQYAEVIARAQSRVPKTPYVSVKRVG